MEEQTAVLMAAGMKVALDIVMVICGTALICKVVKYICKAVANVAESKHRRKNEHE